ncbi:MAG: murein biosynthesis integral membrane protein MurJ, partial [Romboutsia timonensis]|uniref:murein biosynthesis integral membrane protein MurJ n=1 Tax=Romboutsia timonensis TaxID=1776391 RepID=UPI003992576F
TLVEGSISALNYANKLNGFVMALFIASIAAVIYPMLSKLSSEDDKDKFTASVVRSINSVILLVIPISVGAIVLSTPIIKLLFQRGEFDARATSMTAIALIMYSIGMVAFGLRDILGKVFYALQDTKTPMKNGVIAMVMNIVLNIILVKYLQLAGLALATSISAIVCIFLLFGSLKKQIGYFGQDKIIKTTIKSIISAIVMGIVAYFNYNILSNLLGIGFINEAISLVVSIGVGTITYAIVIIALKVEEVNIMNSIINKKLKGLLRLAKSNI